MKIFTRVSSALLFALTLVMGITSCQPKSEPQQETINEIISDTAIVSVTADTVPADVAGTTDSGKPMLTPVVLTPLTITVDKLESPTAPIVLGVYNAQNKFLDDKDELKEYKFKPKNGKFSVKLTDLPYGVYGMAIYQDVNSNGKIDKNLIGIPTEPYAFSNNYHPRTHGPSFDDCKFTYNAKTNTVHMSLIK